MSSVFDRVHPIFIPLETRANSAMQTHASEIAFECTLEPKLCSLTKDHARSFRLTTNWLDTPSRLDTAIDRPRAPYFFTVGYSIPNCSRYVLYLVGS
jgi:hypothetical protein